MKINQAFTILSRNGGVRAARIITENRPKLNTFTVWRMAWQLRRGVPVAKISHKKWFYGLPFYTNKYTLDPRPDTETLVAAVISDCPGNNDIQILDMGTGTGCIIAALGKNIPGVGGVGIDRSWHAVRVARKNIRDLGLSNRISVRRATFQHAAHSGQKFDIIVSNPPYIAHGDARVDAGAMHDPKMALYAGNNGLAAYQEIAQNAHKWLKPDGKIYLEIGIDMGTDVRKIFTASGWKFIRAENDLGGIQRVLVFACPRLA